MRIVVSERIKEGVRVWRVIWTCTCGKVNHSMKNENTVMNMLELMLRCRDCGEKIILHKDDFVKEVVK